MSTLSEDQLSEMLSEDLNNARHHMHNIERTRTTFNYMEAQARAACVDAFTSHARLCFEMLQAMER